MSQNYVYENGQVFTVEEVDTGNQIATVKHNAPNVTYDPKTNTFKDTTDPLAIAKTNKQQELDAAYAASFTTFQSSALGTVHTYPIDKEAQDNMDKIRGLMTLNPNMTTIHFKTIENGMTDHTRDQFVQVLMDGYTFEVNLAKKYEGYETQLNSATTVTDVQAITWS